LYDNYKANKNSPEKTQLSSEVRLLKSKVLREEYNEKINIFKTVVVGNLINLYCKTEKCIGCSINIIGDEDTFAFKTASSWNNYLCNKRISKTFKSNRFDVTASNLKSIVGIQMADLIANAFNRFFHKGDEERVKKIFDAIEVKMVFHDFEQFPRISSFNELKNKLNERMISFKKIINQNIYLYMIMMYLLWRT
jgi:hypothetical protein